MVFHTLLIIQHTVKIRGKPKRHSHLSHLWGNWRHRPSFPSRSREHAGPPPEAGPPSCTGTPGSCTAARTPLETEPLLMTAKQCRRPPMGSPWAPRFHPQPHEYTTPTWCPNGWALGQVESADGAQVPTKHLCDTHGFAASISAEVYFC